MSKSIFLQIGKSVDKSKAKKEYGKSEKIPVFYETARTFSCPTRKTKINHKVIEKNNKK